MNYHTLRFIAKISFSAGIALSAVLLASGQIIAQCTPVASRQQASGSHAKLSPQPCFSCPANTTESPYENREIDTSLPSFGALIVPFCDDSVTA